MIWKYANEIEDSSVRSSNHMIIKGLGNSTTMAFDVDNKETAHLILLSLTEMTTMRLRDSGNMCTLISVKAKTHEFNSYSHQRKLFSATDCTNEIFKVLKNIFDESWDGTPLRHLGIRLSGLITNESYQISIFDSKYKEKYRLLDNTIDDIRMRYGSKSITRAVFLHLGIRNMTGGVHEDYPLMTSIL